MNQEERKKFFQELKQTQEKSQRTLAKVQETLGTVKTTLKDIHETNENIDKVKDSFSTVMEKLALSISQSFGSPLKKIEGKEYDKLPKKIQMDEAIQKMLQYEKVLFVTGAGVSVDSGIPTFRGLNGLYTKKFHFQEKQLQPEAFITKKFFSQHPQAIWEWIQEIYQMSIKAKPNKVHELIHQCALILAKLNKKVTLVTQNIDDLHLKPQKGEYQYHCIHGNAKLMRCDNNHMRNYNKEECMGKCQKCGESLRPHVMFFDESYGVPFGDKVKDEKFPFVIVIGSSLNTGLCIKFACSGQKVIEINPKPVIETGQIYPFDDDTVKTLSEMSKGLQSKLK